MHFSHIKLYSKLMEDCGLGHALFNADPLQNYESIGLDRVLPGYAGYIWSVDYSNGLCYSNF